MKVNEINPELRETLEAICKTIKWDIQHWDALYSAIAVVQTVLKITGQKDLLLPDEHARNERRELAKAILPVLNAGAPINLERGLLLALGFAPKREGKERVEAEREF